MYPGPDLQWVVFITSFFFFSSPFQRSKVAITNNKLVRENLSTCKANFEACIMFHVKRWMQLFELY